ncbi:MAG: hypothetical protein EVA78_08060 [Phycisphaeraceae bacterium]|nr:MAG: hypothetical protein EVA78_08060 [Phycisphaeraceae bacterium]
MTEPRRKSSRSSKQPSAAQRASATAPTESKTRSLAGRLPWTKSKNKSQSSQGVVVTEARERPQEKKQGGLFDPDAPLGPLDFFLSFQWRNALRKILHDSPAWSVSLGLHALILVALLLVSVRVVSQKPLSLTLEFAPQPGPPGIPAVVLPADAPNRADSENVVQELAVSEKDPVKDPDAVPVMNRLVPNQESGAVRSARVVGSLLTGRQEGQRRNLLAAGGGTDQTEQAVQRALAWIVRQQTDRGAYAGLWSLRGPYPDGGSEENRVAATAMALLALQGAGNTPTTGDHNKVVRDAWESLIKTQTDAGNFAPASDEHTSSAGRMYGHGQITIALCEAYGLTRDPKLEQAAQAAIRYALAAQLPDGGWRYHLPDRDENGFLESWKNRGDLSMTGWFLLALKTAEMAGLQSPAIEDSFEQVDGFLDQLRIVSDDPESVDLGYDYQFNPLNPVRKFQPAISAEAILGKLFLGTTPDDPHVRAVVDRLRVESPIAFPESLRKGGRAVEFAAIDARGMNHAVKNIYAWYYITQVCHHVGGQAWREWNSDMCTLLPENQESGGFDRGSWSPAHDLYGVKGGRLFTTALCACMLETYYRHLSLYGVAEKN